MVMLLRKKPEIDASSYEAARYDFVDFIGPKTYSSPMFFKAIVG